MLLYSMGASAVSLLISPPLTSSVDRDKASPYELFLPNLFAHDDLSIHLPDSEHSIVHTDRQSHLCLPVDCLVPRALSTFSLWLSVVVRDRLFTDTGLIQKRGAVWVNQNTRLCRAPLRLPAAVGSSPEVTMYNWSIVSIKYGLWQHISIYLDLVSLTWAAVSRPVCALHDEHTVLSQAVKCGHEFK